MAKRTASKETLEQNVRYSGHSELAVKFINCLMWQGKKATAMRIFDGAMEQIKKRMPDIQPMDVFTQAVEHVKPSVEVRSKRVGGATYQVPMQVNRNASRVWRSAGSSTPRAASRAGRCSCAWPTS